ncbi:MAG: radical SAM protein [Calditrichaeota bacterium]|nr:radical SAM protein [Calditrichota bacterium]
MRVLLLNSPTKNFYGQLGIQLLPLGLAYLAGSLLEDGHQVDVVDLMAEPEKESQIDFGKYELVGISSDTPRYPKSLQLARRAKAEGALVVMGGYHVTFQDREAINSGVVDFVVRGEGEYVLRDLVNALEHTGDVSHVRGISYKADGTCVRNPSAPFIQDLDAIPLPRRDLFPKNKYLSTYDNRPMTTMVTSRGCPFDCAFCSASRFGGLKWRTRSLDSILDEMALLIHQGYRSFLFVDDNFTLNPRRVLDFAGEILRRKWDIRWWCFSRVDTIVKNPDMVRKMAEAGNRTMFLGLESAHQSILDGWGKKITVDEQKEAVRILKENGIGVYASFVLGDRQDTKESIKQTIRYARELDPATCQFSVLTPYPGTRLFEELRAKNLILTYDWRYYDGIHSVIKLENLDPVELPKLAIRAYRKLYFRWKNIPVLIWNVLKKPVNFKFYFDEIFSGLRVMKALSKSKFDLTKPSAGKQALQLRRA